MVDIFKEATEKVVPKWAKFTEAGDGVQGTYVGKIVGQKDGFGWEQVIYQLLQDDGSIINVGMGLNKKVLNADMDRVKFGQLVGFKYKGLVTYYDKRTKKEGKVKDFALFEDPTLVNEKWLKENKDNMPQVTVATDSGSAAENLNKEFSDDDDPLK